jgi:hypothetical protein
VLAWWSSSFIFSALLMGPAARAINAPSRSRLRQASLMADTISSCKVQVETARCRLSPRQHSWQILLLGSLKGKMPGPSLSFLRKLMCPPTHHHTKTYALTCLGSRSEMMLRSMGIVMKVSTFTAGGRRGWRGTDKAVNRTVQTLEWLIRGVATQVLVQCWCGGGCW